MAVRKSTQKPSTLRKTWRKTTSKVKKQIQRSRARVRRLFRKDKMEPAAETQRRTQAKRSVGNTDRAVDSVGTPKSAPAQPRRKAVAQEPQPYKAVGSSARPSAESAPTSAAHPSSPTAQAQAPDQRPLTATEERAEASKQAAAEAQRAALAANTEVLRAEQAVRRAKQQVEKDPGEDNRQQLNREQQRLAQSKRNYTELREAADSAARQTIKDQQAANSAARQDHRTLPYPAAQGIPTETAYGTGAHIARLSNAEQRELLGSSSARPRGAQLQQDAQIIARAAERGPAEGAAALEERLAQPGIDPAYQRQLLQLAQPSLDQISQDLAAHKDDEEVVGPAVASLTRAAEAAGPEGAASIAGTVARHFPDGDVKDLDNAISGSIERGDGALFGASLSNALYEVGKTEGAGDVAKATRKGIDTLRKDFEQAADKVDEHNEELAYMSATYGPMLTVEQQEAAAAAHHERNAEDYASKEEAGARLTSALDGLNAVLDENSAIAQQPATEGPRRNPQPSEAAKLTEAAQRAYEQLPRLASTAAGSDALGRALEQQGKGEDTFLDAMPGVIDVADDPDQLRQDMGCALLDAAHVRAITFDAEGKGARVGELGGHVATALQRIALVDEAEAAQLRETFADLVNVESESDLERWAGDLKTGLRAMKKFHIDSAVGAKIRSFGVITGTLSTAAGIARLPGRYGDFGELTHAERAELLADSLYVGVGGASTTVKALNLASKMPTAHATNLLGSLGRANGALLGVSAAIDAGRAVDAFSDHRYLEGTGYTLSAAGAALGAAVMLGAAIPGGQVAAAALFVGGLAVNQLNKVRQSNRWEGPTERYLEDAGIDPDIAKQLSNHDSGGRSPGPVLTQLASNFGMSPPEMMSWLQTLEPGQVKQIMEAAHGVDPSDEGVYPPGDTDDCTSGDLFDRPDSLNGLVNWMVAWGLAPGEVESYVPSAESSSGGASW